MVGWVWKFQFLRSLCNDDLQQNSIFEAACRRLASKRIVLEREVKRNLDTIAFAKQKEASTTGRLDSVEGKLNRPFSVPRILLHGITNQRNRQMEDVVFVGARRSCGEFFSAILSPRPYLVGYLCPGGEQYHLVRENWRILACLWRYGTMNGRHRAHKPTAYCIIVLRERIVSIFKKNMRAPAVFKFRVVHLSAWRCLAVRDVIRIQIKRNCESFFWVKKTWKCGNWKIRTRVTRNVCIKTERGYKKLLTEE